MISSREDRRKYAGVFLPDKAEVLTGDRAKSGAAKIDGMYTLRKTPSVDFPDAEIMIPNSKYSWRVVRGTLEFLEEEDGFKDEEIIDRFFMKREQGKFLFWNSFGYIDKCIIFSDIYSNYNRKWMMNARFKDNIGVTSESGNLSIISDIFFGFNIISGTVDDMIMFDDFWGGRDKLQRDLEYYVENIMENDRKKLWAIQNLIKLNLEALK
ncbi:hypothetical protein [Nitratireductor sp. ZSWI3]|uniref:hypothetical protein n=1 Tax=Nitratireductor sp. ZSWI3 TaxID=2966359 RepID=UPI00214F8C81|nr:hypothetical protein [Nitratireductor sp. ZSWI3]MCR4269481.1 hypothetical protein [Nitratireductor sp. ZSWI3]